MPDSEKKKSIMPAMHCGETPGRQFVVVLVLLLGTTRLMTDPD